MIYLTRHEYFNAAHKLYNSKWSEEKNLEIFGKCANHNWHGHNYELIVTIKGEIDPDTGFLMDAKALSKLLNDEICERIDHKNLNLDVDFMQGILPSIENLAVAIWEQLIPQLPTNVKLHCVKLYETRNICVEYFG
ncbi:MAG: 6-carboxytetrahydropterin synthase [Sphingobacteriaceae bacterium]|nr:6-carboxytetrahydropterin synthase [Sphingobacteriaceae bacterium]